MYYDKMFLKDPKSAPQLKSVLNNDEYLDSFSAPRIDPTRMGRKVMMTKPKPESSETSSDDDTSSDVEGDDNDDLEDEGNDNDDWEDEADVEGNGEVEDEGSNAEVVTAK